YMSPEQARGKPVDRRTDIWAFGIVLFEMLAGEPVFQGETLTDLLGVIIHKDPDWSALPAGTPPSIARLLRRCLTKDARQRLHDIADARIEIESVTEEQAENVAGTASAHQGLPRKLLWIALTMLLIGTALGVAVSRFGLQPTTSTSESPTT